MGNITQKTCDIFGTVQRKGVRIIEVTIIDRTVAEHEDINVTEDRVLRKVVIEVGKQGLERLLRKIEAGTTPPKPKPRKEAAT